MNIFKQSIFQPARVVYQQNPTNFGARNHSSLGQPMGNKIDCLVIPSILDGEDLMWPTY